MNNEPFRILLADDDEADRLLFKEAFEELKINTNVQSVNNGEQLMEYLNRKGIVLPEILFLDLNMPRKNGFECLKEIRSNKKFDEISIAIYSTSAAERDIEATFIAGANVYISKPNDFNELKQVLEKAVMSAHVYHEPPFNKANFLLRI
ncbi:MAG TPA: response regulator [Cyclobacteriaceae bacterium]|nr:response regulator [Cyclobacteriaceae bacterium]HPW63739.1 response regulator [Cyclobacteriaceae bacterium]